MTLFDVAGAVNSELLRAVVAALSSYNRGVPSFAAIIRTTGERPRQLLQALQSVSLQQTPCLSIVVVHGAAGAFSRVTHAVAGNGAAPQANVLHANDTQRKLGHPFNIGLDYCLAHQPAVEFVFLLDDDDIVYPFFTSMLGRAFSAGGADVVYAASNRREPGELPSAGCPALPFYALFKQNFIATNSYAVRLEALRKSGLRMDETIEYLEDWHFLLRMLESGFRFHALPIELSEFRIAAARERERNDSPRWKEISERITQYIHATCFSIPGAELARLGLPDPATNDLHAAFLNRRIQELEHSLCWRWTAPARQIAGLFRVKAGRPKTGA